MLCVLLFNQQFAINQQLRHCTSYSFQSKVLNVFHRSGNRQHQLHQFFTASKGGSLTWWDGSNGCGRLLGHTRGHFMLMVFFRCSNWWASKVATWERERSERNEQFILAPGFLDLYISCFLNEKVLIFIIKQKDLPKSFSPAWQLQFRPAPRQFPM